ncbi:MAG: glycosyltransferase [Bacteroidia bacterium]
MKDSLKIFIIGPAYPLRGGPAQFNENLCEELMKAGHDAQIISYSLQYPNFLFPGSSQFDESGNRPDNLKIHTLINTINPFSWFKTARFIKREKPDFILFRFWLPFFGPALGTIGRRVRKHTKVLALTDNIFPHEKRIGDKAFTNYFIKSCHGFITMSRKVMEDISAFTKTDNKTYSPHPMYETYGKAIEMQEAREQLKLKKDDKIILFFGLIRHYKGLDVLLKAMNHPQIKKDKIKLLIAGEFYEDREPYLNLIKKLDLGEHVILHDKFIPNEDVRLYFCASNLVAQTYRNATNSGVSMVSYYYDKPLLVTNVGGLAEIVPHGVCGYCVDFDPNKISESIIDYFSQNREKSMTEAVKKEKTKYEWSTFINNLLALYNRC